MSLQIKTNLPATVAFTFGEMASTFLGPLEVVNEGSEALDNLVLELSCEQPFFESRNWNIESLAAHTNFPITDSGVKILNGFFSKLPQPVAAGIRLRLMRGCELLTELRGNITLTPPQPRLSLIYDHSINYAFQQNSIPLVKELRLQNNGIARQDLVLRLTTEPAFALPVDIRLQAIEPGAEFRISPPDLKVKLSHDFLEGLAEKVTGWLKLEMLAGDEVIQSITEPINLLARNEWCGMVALPEILAAFILPNDPAVMHILGRASEILKEATGRSSLNAYQDKNRKRVWEQVAAIYKAIGELDIRYIVAPASFESTGQKVRLPSEILSQRFGNCLDLSLLFAACCEQAGLRPFVFIHDGHAYAGCWLEERSLPEPAGDELRQVRKDVDLELVTVFETTAVTGGSPGTLNEAELFAKPHLSKDDVFRLALDVHAARSARIHPLPVPGQTTSGQQRAGGMTERESSASGLGDRTFSDDIEISATGPSKPSNRIDLWKSRLLDLSLRNRLLNLRETKATIRLLAEPDHLEDELASDRELSLRPKPKLMSENDPRNAAVHTREQRADALKDHLKEELRVGRLHTHLEENEHSRRLTELFRSARNALDENGTNTLFAAVGILEWRETEHSDRVHRAPLLLIPVELKRKSVLEGFTLRRMDEETRINFTLMEMLKQNFRKEIPGLDPLPEDENGVDVPRVIRIFRDAVRDLSGWEVHAEVWLGQFSFTKFLLWKDLADRLEDLTKNRLVSHLIHDAGTQISNPHTDIHARDLDDRFHPRQVLCPRSADSSQLAAVMAAADGHDFVLEGPPGTGKSQTITNIIANCLAGGKRVLFVAEKRAALDVVHRRLREDGLEPFCLELHSNKTGKAEVLAQFDSTLKFVETAGATDWEYRAAELQRLRDALNSYTRALHQRHACGLSAHSCLDYLLPRKDDEVVRFDGWPDILNTTAETLDEARRISRNLQSRSQPLLPLADHPLAPVAHDDWAPDWEERTVALGKALIRETNAASAATHEVLAWLQCSRPLSSEEITRLDSLLQTLLAPEPVGSGFPTTAWSQLSAELDSWSSWAEEREALRAALAPHYLAFQGTLLPCETLSPESGETLFLKGRELVGLLQKSIPTTSSLLTWLRNPEAIVSRGLHSNLLALAESLLEAEKVGEAFVTSSWESCSALLDRWIPLAQERAELRKEIHGYSEDGLLSLDLDLLQEKWQKAQTSWFLPKMLNTAAVRKQLTLALPAKTKPDPLQMGQIISSTLRLREINAEESTSHSTAGALLGRSWGNGEPDPGELSRIRSWGETFHQRLERLAGGNASWLADLRSLLAVCFKTGAETLGAGTPDGERLAAFCDNFKAFAAASDSFTNLAALDRRSLDDESHDHFSTTSSLLNHFLTAAPRLRELSASFAAISSHAQNCLGTTWRKGEPDAAEIRKARTWGDSLHSRLLAFAGEDLAWLGSCRHLLSSLFAEGPDFYAQGTAIGDRLTRFREQWAAYNRHLGDYSAAVRLRRDFIDPASDHLACVRAVTERISGAWNQIRQWCSWQKIRHEAIQSGLAPLVENLESVDRSSSDVPALFERSFRRSLLNAITARENVLREFFGSEHVERIERFRELDGELAKLSRDLIRARLAAGIPRDTLDDGIPKAEMGLLRKELGKRMRHIPVRQLIGRIPTLLPRLKPCVLMSPLSVAQYLEASHETFDVVIFDEASQIPVWDAVGAIARGRQLIIVGDPKQLPPTNFFSTQTDDEDDLTPDEHKDLESILDELMTHGLRHKRLQWHYRSRHEGLITFSNRQYYDNDLLTFPSPELELGGVRFHHVPNARYDKGKSRTNRLEAEALVKELVSRLRDPKAPRRSYGVVTFSQAQQALVENLIDEERRKYPEIENHFGDEPPVEGEPVFVKNLENVQGDERDIILFSICYGMDEAGKLSMNFGPLNRDGGERRLNVAVTRAKHEVLVFSGLRGDQIDLTRTQRRGVRDLKYFLEYAERGPRALVAATTGASLADADSEFERMVADRIRKAGYEVHHQVGCSGYRIDLAVVDPMSPGRYLLGVECDGATYHRAATARDRDKLRQAVLEDLGWNLHRIWSTDWWHAADAEISKLLLVVEKLKEEREIERASMKEQLGSQGSPENEGREGDSIRPENDASFVIESSVSALEGSRYLVADFGALNVGISSERFYESSYDATLVQLIEHVLTSEAPISTDLLVNRLARAHGFLRSGRLIQDRILNLAGHHFHVRQDPIEGIFVWRDQDSPNNWTGFRIPVSEDGSRRIEEIAFEELRAAVTSVSTGDIPVEVSRMFGIRRLAASGRLRLEAVLHNFSSVLDGEQQENQI